MEKIIITTTQTVIKVILWTMMIVVTNTAVIDMTVTAVVVVIITSAAAAAEVTAVVVVVIAVIAAVVMIVVVINRAIYMLCLEVVMMIECDVHGASLIRFYSVWKSVLFMRQKVNFDSVPIKQCVVSFVENKFALRVRHTTN